MGNVKLSQCMIVKNEENNIERALTWAKGIVSEQIVVDTGSTDRTVEIAEEMGAKVYHFDWINDFAAAKNYAIEQASGDWILFLDADEYVLREEVDQISYLADQIDRLYPDKPCSIQCMKVELNAAGEAYCEDLCERIFTKRDIHYVGNIHEILMTDDGRILNIYNAHKEIKIYHTGYSTDEFVGKDKLNRNRQLLQEKLDANPDNPIALMYMGDNYEAEERWEEADEYYKRSISLLAPEEENQSVLTHNYAERLRILEKLGRTEEFNQVYEAAVAYDPAYPDFYFYRGFSEYGQEHVPEAIGYLEQAIEASKTYTGIAPSVTYTQIPKLFRLLLQLSDLCRDRGRVVQYAIFLLQMDKYDEFVLQSYLREMSSDVADDGSGLFGILNQLYDFNETKDRMLVLKCVRQAGNKNIEPFILQALIDDDN